MVRKEELKLSDVNATAEEKESLNKKTNEIEDIEAEQQTKNREIVSFFSLYRYSNTKEKCLFLIAVVFAIFCGIANTIMFVWYGQIAGDIVDYVQATNKLKNISNISTENDIIYSKVHYYVTKVVTVGFLVILLGYLSQVLFSYTAGKQVTRMRNFLLSRMLNADIEWHDKNKTSNFTTIFTENLSKIEEGMGPRVCLLICDASSFVSGVVFSFYEGWKLTLVCLSPLPILLITARVVSWFSAKFAVKELDSYGAAGSLCEEVFGSIRTVVAFDAQKSESLRYEKYLSEAKNNNIKKGFFNALSLGLTAGLYFANFAIAYGYGAKLVTDDMLLPVHERSYNPSVCFIIINCILIVQWKFELCIPMIEVIGLAKGAAVNVFAMLDIEPVINKSKMNGRKLSSIKGSLKINNVHFSYPSRRGITVLKGVNFEINQGETVAIVGHSGCGKSTIIQLIQRFYDPVEGSILLDGIDLKDLNLSWLRSKIGVVSQEPVLFDTSILENIRLGNLEASDEQIEMAAKKANAHEFISQLSKGYHTQIGECGSQLSGGQKQRVAIARALIKSPRFLLLDEATSALDTNSEAEVQAALDQIRHECTTIVVAHRLTTVRNADRIIVMDDGQVKEQGSHTELMNKQGAYYALVQSNTSEINEGDQLQKSETSNGDVVFNEINEEKIQASLNPTCSELNGSVNGDLDNNQKTGEDSHWLGYKILMFNKPEWHLIFFGCLFAIAAGMHYPLSSFILADLIGAYGDANGELIMEKTKTVLIFVVIMAIVSTISTTLSALLLSMSGERLTLRLRKKMFEVMVNKEISWHDKEENGVGALCANLSSTAESVQQASGNRVGIILKTGSVIIFCVMVGLVCNWKLALVTLSFSPVIMLSTYFAGNLAMRDNEISQSLLEKSVKIAVEALSNIRTVASIGCENVFYKSYAEELENHRKVLNKRIHLRSLTEASSLCLTYFASSTGTAYGLSLIIKENLHFSEVFRVVEVIITGSWTVGAIFSYLTSFQDGYSAARRVFQLLGNSSKHIDACNLIEVKGDVTYESVNFSYPMRPTTTVLAGLNLQINEGKTIALVGGSGSGKSTVVQLLLRYYEPSSGKICLGGRDISKLPPSEVRRRLGVVSQEPNLFDRTIAENIAYGERNRDVSISEIIKVAKLANIHDFISSLPLGYETRLGPKGTQLSGGQKQRIAIARALIRKPYILLLDEATSALDNESEKVVQEALDKAREGRTCLIIAHRLTTIKDADLICVIQNGRVVETGTHAELLNRKGVYYDYFKLQVAV